MCDFTWERFKKRLSLGLVFCSTAIHDCPKFWLFGLLNRHLATCLKMVQWDQLYCLSTERTEAFWLFLTLRFCQAKQPFLLHTVQLNHLISTVKPHFMLCSEYKC